MRNPTRRLIRAGTLTLLLAACKTDETTSANATGSAKAESRSAAELSAVCRGNKECRTAGECKWTGDAECDPSKEPVKCCEPASDEDCRQSEYCKAFADCSEMLIKWEDGSTTVSCAVKSDADCARSDRAQGKAYAARGGGPPCSGAPLQQKCVCESR